MHNKYPHTSLGTPAGARKTGARDKHVKAIPEEHRATHIPGTVAYNIGAGKISQRVSHISNWVQTHVAHTHESIESCHA